MRPTSIGLRLEWLQWLQMRLPVPADWQVVRHSARANRGQLALIDRRNQRLLLSWLECPQSPDLAQAFHDYRRADENAHPDAAFEPLPTIWGWTGYRLRTACSALTRAGCWSRTLGRWIELVLDWPDGFDQELEAALCGNFEIVAGPQANRWKVFGLDVAVPEGWTLSHAKAKPGDATLIFANGAGKTFLRRRATMNLEPLPEATELLWRWQPEMSSAPTRVIHNHHPAAASRWPAPTVPLLRWLGLGHWHQDLLWVCPESGASFHLAMTTPRKQRDVPTQFVVRCCGKEEP